MTQGAEWKCILFFALPIMAGQLLQQLYSTVDGIIVGNFVSPDALGAVGNCGTLVFVYLAVAMGMSNGCGIVVAQLFGAGRREEMRRAASTALILLFIMGTALTVFAVSAAGFTVDHLLHIEDRDIADMAISYMRFYSVGLLFQFMYNAVAAILRSVGDSKAVLYFLLVSTVVNTLLDLLFVAVFNWGVAGAAVATAIAQVACCIVSFIYMFRRYPDFSFRPGELVFDKDKLRQCLRMGIPTTIQHLIISCGHLFLQRLVNSFGPSTMAAYTVGSRYDHYAGIPTFGMFQAMAAFAGQNTGAGRYDRVKRGIFAAVCMSLAAVIVICILMHTFAAPLSVLFGVEGESLRQSVEYLQFIALFFPIFAIYIPFNGMYQGCGAVLASTTSSLLALTARVSASYFMAYVLDWGYSACWEPCAIGWGSALVWVLIYFAGGRWKTKSLVKEQG